MRTFVFASVIASVAFTSIIIPASAAITLSGVYDPGSDANDVDANAAFASGTGGITAANRMDLAAFKPLVADAFATGTGGVLSFDDPSDTIDSSIAFTSSPFSGLTTTFTFTTGNTSIFSETPPGAGNRLATSGGSAIQRGVNDDFNFSGFTVNGAGAGIGLTHFGATLIHRAANQNWSVTANFSGGGSLTFSPVTFTSTDDINTKDTFFGVVAPQGETISSVIFTGSNYTWIDDVAFITNIPEPTTTSIGFLGAILLLRRRRA